jgi:hypothetical protein
MLILPVFLTRLLMISARECELEKRKTSENLMRCFLLVSQMPLNPRKSSPNSEVNLAMVDQTP